MINYSNIDKSIKYYAKLGYSRVEVPWTVTKAVSEITKPSHKKDIELTGKNKVLVASAEQSFIYQYIKGFLPKGKFQAVTPCFRDEVFDFTHSKYFMKNELINTQDISVNSLKSMVDNSVIFFKNILNTNHITFNEDIMSKKSYDVIYYGSNKQIELGSYGIREYDNHRWIYGTAIAEPRTTIVKEIIENQNYE